MSLVGSGFGNLPGIQTAVETFEAAAMWGPFPRYWTNGWISSSAADPTNTPTWELRPGLIMGIVTATGQWINYSATATDGSQVAQGILTQGLRMQDVFTGSNTQKFYGIMVSGGVQAAKLIGLDLRARQTLGPLFIFDDFFPGNRWAVSWMRFVTKTSSYQILASDNFTLFDNTGAVGAVTFTLPVLANGYEFGFLVVADQTVTVASSEGTNIIALNNASASSLAFSTGSQKIGGSLILFSNPGATKWIAYNVSAGTNTITVA